ncbi:hypothetical protein LCGC14_2703590 [marine sediment metagenome]|uniref:Uncharacterized protein n=1 Tax=marine sediment metagenome TaxID=412755 RepID=A0A0F8ZF00_9ZZZZ
MLRSAMAVIKSLRPTIPFTTTGPLMLLGTPPSTIGYRLETSSTASAALKAMTAFLALTAMTWLSVKVISVAFAAIGGVGSGDISMMYRGLYVED